MESRFIALYNKVFDKNGNINPCGRKACQELIDIASQIDKTSNYGNIKTGFLNVDTIKALYTKIEKR